MRSSGSLSFTGHSGKLQLGNPEKTVCSQQHFQKCTLELEVVLQYLRPIIDSSPIYEIILKP